MSPRKAAHDRSPNHGSPPPPPQHTAHTCILGLRVMPAPRTSLMMSQVRHFALGLLVLIPDFA